MVCSPALPARPARLLAALAFLFVAACGEKPEAAATAERPLGHVFTDTVSGVGVDLPPMWAGRYRVSDSITTPVAGLQRQLALRYLKSDSSLVAEPALLEIRVFGSTEWMAMGRDSASAMYGTVIASDPSHTVAVRPASMNPLTPGTADAVGFDSLMIIVLQRPLTASLRAPK